MISDEKASGKTNALRGSVNELDKKTKQKRKDF